VDPLDSLKARRNHNQAVVAANFPSEDPSAYTIKARDYKRNNADERYYRQRWILPLLSAFDCKCALCDSSEDGFELDHFWIPKTLGGNLLLKLKNSNKFVNNGVPLCQTCNRQKSESQLTVSDIRKHRIHTRSRDLTIEINGEDIYEHNEELLGMRDGDLERAKTEMPYLKKIIAKYESDPNSIDLDTIKITIENFLLIPRSKL
jgi:5-methylcytosine-specific restriction endonuclease McrA